MIALNLLLYFFSSLNVILFTLNSLAFIYLSHYFFFHPEPAAIFVIFLFFLFFFNILIIGFFLDPMLALLVFNFIFACFLFYALTFFKDIFFMRELYVDLCFENVYLKVFRTWTKSELYGYVDFIFSKYPDQWNFTEENRSLVVDRVWKNTRTLHELQEELALLLKAQQPYWNYCWSFRKSLAPYLKNSLTLFATNLVYLTLTMLFNPKSLRATLFYIRYNSNTTPTNPTVLDIPDS